MPGYTRYHGVYLYGMRQDRQRKKSSVQPRARYNLERTQQAVYRKDPPRSETNTGCDRPVLLFAVYPARRSNICPDCATLLQPFLHLSRLSHRCDLPLFYGKKNLDKQGFHPIITNENLRDKSTGAPATGTSVPPYVPSQQWCSHGRPYRQRTGQYYDKK